MIKVCHVTSVHPNNDGRIFRLECQSLASNGYDVFLVAQGNSREENGVHVIGIGEMPQSRLKRMTSFTGKIVGKALELNCDIYHLHDPELLQYARKIKKKGKKVIFDSHENTLEQIDEKKWIPVLIRRPISWLYNLYARNILKKIDGCISVTPHIVNQLKEINQNTCMVTNYPRYIDYMNTKQRSDQFFLCFTGGIEAQWNHKRIISAIDKITNVSYNLCGAGSETYIKDLEKTAGWEKVHYYGKVPFEKSVKIQLQSDVGVAILEPSRNTAGKMGTIGNTKLFEYMMAGLPVICTDFVLWKDVVVSHNCGICISPGNEEELINAIQYLIDNPDIAIIMGENGKNAVKNVYNWESQEKELLNMYNSIIKGSIDHV